MSSLSFFQPRFCSGCHPKKNQVELYPIFFRVAKAPIFSKLKIGCSLKGRLSTCRSKKFCFQGLNQTISESFNSLCPSAPLSFEVCFSASYVRESKTQQPRNKRIANRGGYSIIKSACQASKEDNVNDFFMKSHLIFFGLMK